MQIVTLIEGVAPDLVVRDVAGTGGCSFGALRFVTEVLTFVCLIFVEDLIVAFFFLFELVAMELVVEGTKQREAKM